MEEQVLEADADTVDQVGEDLDAVSKMKQREQEHYEAIRELNSEFVSVHAKWEILKDQAAGAKKCCDELGKRLSNLISMGPDAQLKLHLDDDDDDDDQVAVDAWRDALVVDALGLTAAQLGKLEDEGIRTMGELEDFRASDGLGSIKGFGEKAVTKIEDQIIDWLTENRDRFGEVIDDDSELDDDDDEGEDDESDPLDEI